MTPEFNNSSLFIYLSSRNSCFAGNDRLVGDGVFDVTVCQFDSPIIISWPHFLGAEDKFREAVTGMNPEKVSRVVSLCVLADLIFFLKQVIF